MRQSSLLYVLPLVFICALFLSACGSHQVPEASNIDQEVIDRLARATTSPIRLSESTQRDIPLSRLAKEPLDTEDEEVSQTKTPLPTVTENPTNTPQPTSEASEKVETPLFEPSSPESRTPPITTTLTPRNRLPRGEASGEGIEGVTEKEEMEKDQEASPEPTQEANEEEDQEASSEEGQEASLEPTQEANQEEDQEASSEKNEEGAEEESEEESEGAKEESEETSLEESGEESTEEVPNLPAGNTVHFQARVEANKEDSYLFLATPQSVVLVHTETQTDLTLSVEVQDMLTRQPLQVFSRLEDQDTAVYKIPAEGGPLYRVSIKSVDQAAGNYRGFFIGSAGIGFNLLPTYAITARLPEDGTLAYTYTGKSDTTVQFDLSPRPDDELDLMVRIYNLDDLGTPIREANESGIDETEQFSFTPPADELTTYLIMVREASGQAGKFKMRIQKGESSDPADDLTQIWTFF